MKTCPVCDIGKLHPRVIHGKFKLRKMLKHSVCDSCGSELADGKQLRWNVARGKTNERI